MATHTVTKSVTATLSGTTADTVNLTQPWDTIEISNRGTVPLFVAWNGTTAVSSADNTDIVEAGVTKTFQAPVYREWPDGSANAHVLSVVGNGNVFTVAGG